jgi:transmembrane sensor
MPQRYDDVDDLLADETFLGWYLKSNKKDIDDWDQWISENQPESRLIFEAVHLLDRLKGNDVPVPASQVAAAEAKLFSNAAFTTAEKWRFSQVIRSKWIIAAAAVVVVVLGAFFIQQGILSRSRVNTQFGEIKSQILPDGSEVLLNANSEVNFSDSWKQGTTREVWVKGEAYFKVKKTASKSLFIVHTNKFDIYVTGTQFNVMNREDKSNVLLQEGQVILRRQEGKDIVMAPGDFLEFNDNHFQKRLVSTETVVAWKDRKIDFNNTLLTDALHMIEQHYGVHVKIGDESLVNKRITGILPNDNLDVLIEALSALNEFQVEYKDNNITITKQVHP